MVKFSYLTLIIISSSSSSSRCAANTDLLDIFLPSFSIAHRSREVFQATSCIGTELLHSCFSSSSYLCSSMGWDPLEYVTHELVLTSPAVSRISGSSNLDTFGDGWWVAIQMLFCRLLPPGPVQYCSQHPYVIAIKLFLHTFT